MTSGAPMSDETTLSDGKCAGLGMLQRMRGANRCFLCDLMVESPALIFLIVMLATSLFIHFSFVMLWYVEISCVLGGKNYRLEVGYPDINLGRRFSLLCPHITHINLFSYPREEDVSFKSFKQMTSYLEVVAP